MRPLGVVGECRGWELVARNIGRQCADFGAGVVDPRRSEDVDVGRAGVLAMSPSKSRRINNNEAFCKCRIGGAEVERHGEAVGRHRGCKQVHRLLGDHARRLASSRIILNIFGSGSSRMKFAFGLPARTCFRLDDGDAISRFPIPDLEELPDDIRERILTVQEKSGFIPNVFLALLTGQKSSVPLRVPRRTHGSGPATHQGRREMIVVTTSSLNQCQYCVVAHGAIVRIRTKDPALRPTRCQLPEGRYLRP